MFAFYQVRGFAWFVFGCLAMLMAVSAVQAATITIPNGSWETPVTAADYGDAQDGSTSGWRGIDLGHFNNGYVGWFAFSNATGNQLGRHYDGAGLFNGVPYGNAYQTLTATYEVGKSYTFSTDFGRRSDYPGSGSGTIREQLGYMTGAPDSLGTAFVEIVGTSILGSTLHTGDGGVVGGTPEGPSDGPLLNFSVTTPTVQGTDAWVGQAITIRYLNTTIDAPGNGVNFVYDNAQLSSVVPEPGTLALLAAGLFGLLAYAWRKRK